VDTTYTAYFTSGPPNGDGLLGTYFDNRDLTNQKLVRVDPTVSFSWGTGSPDPSIGRDSFSVRWTGFVQPQFTETYTFYVNADDGARLRVNGQLLFDRSNGRPGEGSGTISLNAGQKYAIVLEYDENKKSAFVTLSWSSASQPKQVIPQVRLYSQ
jgi:hypothetical protein